MRKLLLYTFALFLSFTAHLDAQNVLLYNSKQGLTNSCTNQIYEDSRHNIWIATLNGLNRYDGVKFNTYFHNDENKSSLMHDEVINVFEYDRDNIIISTGAGIQIYNYATDKFTTVPFLGANGDTIKVRFGKVSRVHYDGKVHITACFSGYGHAELTRNAKNEFSITHEQNFIPAPNDGNILQFFEDKQGKLWLTTSSGNLYLYNNKDKTFRKYPEIANAIKMLSSNRGINYVATSDKGLYRYDKATDKYSLVASANDLGGVVYGINPMKDNKLIICTDGGGIRIFEENTGKVTESALRINNFDLATSNVKDAICDTYGNVWAGIYWLGVMMKPFNQTAFEYIGRNSITKNTIGSNSVFALAKANDSQLWVAPDNDGIYLVSQDGTASYHYSKATNPGMPAAFTAIYPLQPTLSSPILLGTYFNGLWVLENGSFSLLTKEINQIFDIQPADNGNVWIATMGNGIYYYNPRTKQHAHYVSTWSNEENEMKILGNPYDYCVLSLGKQLFVGTADGVNILVDKGNGILDPKFTKILGTYAIKHLAVSNDKKYVWAATNNGLYRIDAKTHEQKRYSISNGLANNSAKAVYVKDKIIWIATDNGLSCLNSDTEEFTNFFADDGLQDNEFNRGTILYSFDKMYIGGISGLTYFEPNKILNKKKDSNELKLRLVDIRINGVAKHVGDLSGSYQILSGVLDDCSRIDLDHTDSRFVIDLCVEGLNNQHVNYQYSVNGGEWTDQGDPSNRILFTNYGPGTYNVRIRANAFNAMSQERELIIVIHPAWYKSVWAKFIYFLIFILICYLAYLYTKRQLAARRVIERHRHEEQIHEARIQFFMNISHEIRTPMTLILAPLEKLLGSDKDPEHQRNYKLMKQNANRILSLINQMMDVRKIEQGKFQLVRKNVNLVSLLQNTFEVFKIGAQNRNIEYTYTHDVESLATYIDPENFDKIVMNLLSNAFKFTPDGGKISVDLKTIDLPDNELTSEGKAIKSPYFRLTVTDTGVGIPDTDKKKVFERFYSSSQRNGYIGTGIGLNLTWLLVNLHKGNIKVTDNAETTGSTFCVNIPLTDLNVKPSIPAEPAEPANETVNVQKPQVDDEVLSDEKVKAAITGSLILVEDDSSIRQYVHSELAPDINVIDFSDGQQAWDYIIANPDKVSFVVSDIMMPVMDGLTLCQKLKSNFNTNHIPILLMTALGSDADRIVGITNGADAYISKPFNIDVLRTTIIGILKNRMLLQGRFKSEKLQEESIEKKELESPDENLMRRVMKAINDNLDNDELSVEMIADLVGISRVHFYRKMKDMTGQSPREFLKYVRLKEAARLLSSKRMDIASVSTACGFKSPSAFSTYFKSLYGVSPSEFVKKQNAENK